MFGREGGLDKIAPTSPIVLTMRGALQLTVDFAGRTWPEIAHAIGQCATAPRASRFCGDMLRREGIDERPVRAL